MPFGMNAFANTNAFVACDPAALVASHPCHDPEIGAQSCWLTANELVGTGFESSISSGGCSLGAGTYWTQFEGGVVPGQIATLRFVVFDAGDALGDTVLLLDQFEWHWTLGPVAAP